MWQLNELMPASDFDKSDLIEMYAAVSRKQAYDMAYIGWAPDVYLEMLEELRGFVSAPNKDDIIVLSFTWQLLHELGHIKQFSGAKMDNHAPLAFSLFDIPKLLAHRKDPPIRAGG
ncbi:hypothetical protein [Rhizobium sp. NPDC090279]|uniref:hypothetical protein n=1 Tax=Rhizobium sp. NPDC090279 TaxID=3364499 RepID=UPI00383B9122